jgi:glycosyltransferase involved in cell wall biosynthesis
MLVHAGTDLYGASRSLLRLATRLVADGHQITVVLPQEGPLSTRLSGAGVPFTVHADLGAVTRLELGSMRGRLRLGHRVPRSVLSLAREIDRWRPDLVHTNTALIVSPGLASRWRGIPHVWHIREFFSEFPVLWRAYQRFVYWFSDSIVCVSRAVAGQFESSFGDKVRVVHNGLPSSEFDSISEERVQAFRHRYGLDGFRSVGVVGRIKTVRKGQETFLRAAALINERHPGVRFLLIGSPFPGNEAHLANLRRLIGELGLDGRVIFTGDVDDIGAAYAALDVVVLPSGIPEPFAGVVVEAMACGKPVVGTRHGGTVEQIEDGRTGFLVEPNQPESLAGSLDRLLSDAPLRRAMGLNAHDRFQKSFEFEAYYSRMLAVYEEVTARRVRRPAPATNP